MKSVVFSTFSPSDAYICVIEQGHHRPRWWLVTCLVTKFSEIQFKIQEHYFGTNNAFKNVCKMLTSLFTTSTLRTGKMTTTLADDIFKCISLKENFWILNKISLKYIPKGVIDNMAALVQIMAWCRPGDKPLSEPMMVNLLTYIFVTWPQWVNSLWHSDTIWQHRSRSTLAQVMACCLTAPSHYLNQCWLINKSVAFTWGQFHKRYLSHQSLN